MPALGKAWWHSQFSTYCSWLPGDIRGFRNREHRIHSSGNYRSPPPSREHRGLREYHKQRHPEPVEVPRNRRLQIATAIAETLIGMGYRVLAVAVARKHAHIVAELPINEPEYNHAIGRAKSKSSRAIKDILPGAVWQRGDRHDLLRDRAYQLNAFRYVRDKQGPTAAIWCFDGLRREAAQE